MDHDCFCGKPKLLSCRLKEGKRMQKNQDLNPIYFLPPVYLIYDTQYCHLYMTQK